MHKRCLYCDRHHFRFNGTDNEAVSAFMFFFCYFMVKTLKISTINCSMIFFKFISAPLLLQWSNRLASDLDAILKIHFVAWDANDDDGVEFYVRKLPLFVAFCSDRQLVVCGKAT